MPTGVKRGIKRRNVVKKSISVLVLFVLVTAGAFAQNSSSAPTLGTPTLWQQALNLLPAVPIAGNNLKFQLGGDAWKATLNGRDFLAGTLLFQDTDAGVIVLLKQTHTYPALPAQAGAVGSAVTALGRVTGWIAASGPEIILEYKKGPPASLKPLSRSELPPDLAAGRGSSSGSTAAGRTVAASPATAPAGQTNVPPVFLEDDAVPAQGIKLAEVIAGSAKRIEEALPRGTTIVALNFVSPSGAFSDYVIEELTGALVGGRKVAFVDSRNLAFIRREMNLQTSRELNEEIVQGLGRLLGAQSVVSGTLTSMGNFYHFRVRVINVETAAIQAQASFDLQDDAQVAFLLGGRLASAQPARVQPERAQTQPARPTPKPAPPPQRGYIQDDENARLKTLGGSVGTSFADPALILTIRGTFALARNWFMEPGIDLGFVSIYKDVASYFSAYPFIHTGLFLPFEEKGGWYVGTGIGGMLGAYTFAEGKTVSVGVFATDFITGFNFGNIFDISWTLRTDFRSVNSKLSMGFVKRFE